MVFQSTVRPFPIQPLADSARDLGDTEGGVIAGRLTHQGDIFGGKTASGKADDGEIVHVTSEKRGLRTVGYQIQHDRNRRPEQLRDPIEGVFALLTARGEDADQNLLGLRAIFGPIAAPGSSGHHSWTQRPFGGMWKARGRCRYRCQHGFTSPEQMAQAGLMKRIRKTIVGLPAVMVQKPGVIGTQYRGRLSKSTSGQNRIYGDIVADTNPKPFQMRGHSPPGFIEVIDETVTGGSLKLLIGGLRFLAQPRHRPAQRASADSQIVTPYQYLSCPLMRDPHLFAHMGSQRQCLRTHLYVCRSQGIGRLQGVSALNMSTASAAMTRLHIEAPDDGPSDDVFLILSLRVIVNHPPATVWTLLRQSNRNPFTHMSGNCTERQRPVLPAFLPPRP